MTIYGSINSFDITIFLLFLCLFLLWYRWRRPSNYPPGPTPWPVIGNFHQMKGNTMDLFRNFRIQYGDIYSLSLGNFWFVVVNGRDNLRELLVKRGEVTSDRPGIYQVKVSEGHNGVIRASGHDWKKLRTFSLSKLRDFGFGKRSFESSIQEEMGVFLKTIDTFKGEPFDMNHVINISLSNVVMFITVGKRYEYDDPVFTYFVQNLEANLKDKTINGIVNYYPILAKLPGDIFGCGRFTERVREVIKFFEKEVDYHEDTFDEKNIRDFTDTFLQEIKNKGNSSKFTKQELVGTIIDLFAAGTETTATTIKWAILFLMWNPEMQEKMWTEIDDVVGSGRYPSMKDKPNMPYSEAVMLESLRLGNIVPFALPHSVTEDIHYKGCLIPKHAVIIPNLDSVCHDETLFPNSNQFKPERFLGDNGEIVGQENILTFSLGRRVCLGESLARLELFLYLTALVQRFRFLPADGDSPPPIEGELGVTYSPLPYRMRAVQRL